MEQSWWQPATQANNFQISTPAELPAGVCETFKSVLFWASTSQGGEMSNV